MFPPFIDDLLPIDVDKAEARGDARLLAKWLRAIMTDGWIASSEDEEEDDKATATKEWDELETKCAAAETKAAAWETCALGMLHGILVPEGDKEHGQVLFDVALAAAEEIAGFAEGDARDWNWPEDCPDDMGERVSKLLETGVWRGPPQEQPTSALTVVGGRRGLAVVEQADAVSWMAQIPSGTVDCIITDPAYESLERHRAIGTTTRLTDWFEIFPNSRFPDLFRQAYRILRKDTHFYLLCDQETAFIVKQMGEQAGFKFWKAITWDKRAFSTGYHYRGQTEWILFFEKGHRNLVDRSMSDLRPHRKVYNGYPTEKPVTLLQDLVYQSTQPGEWVVDSFVGSGSCGEATVSLGRNFLGCDLSPKAVNIATERLAGGVYGVRG